MFKLLKKEKEETKELKAFVSGNLIPIEAVPDEVFSKKILGDGMAIWPDEGKLYAPADARVSLVMTDSNHACGLEFNNKIQILLHIGIDTVDMNGTGFKLHVKEGQKVKAGQLLISFDREEIKKAGFKDIVMMVITENPMNIPVEMVTGKVVVAKETMIMSM